MPQLHYIENCVKVNRSRAYPLINACKEARKAAFFLKLDYYSLNDGDYDYTAGRNYFTRELDIFYLGRTISSAPYHLNDDLYSWHCGVCETVVKLKPTGPVCTCSRKRGYSKGGPLRLPRMAIDLSEFSLPEADSFVDFWDEEVEDEEVWGTAKVAYLFGVEEIFLVVETFGSFAHAGEVVFDTPSESTRRYILKNCGRYNSLSVGGETWAESAELLRSQMRKLQESRREDFQEAFDSK